MSSRFSPTHLLLSSWKTLRRRGQRKPPTTPSVASLQEAYLPIKAIGLDHLVLADGGLRAVWRVWGIDLARLDPDDQTQWRATYELFLTSTFGWQAQWRASTRRSRMEEYLAHAERTLARGELSPELEGIARERIADRRQFAGEVFLTKPVFHFVVPGDDLDQLDERAADVEGWFAQLRLPHTRLGFVDLAVQLAQDYDAEPPDRRTLVPYLGHPVSVAVVANDLLAHANVPGRATLVTLGLPLPM